MSAEDEEEPFEQSPVDAMNTVKFRLSFEPKDLKGWRIDVTLARRDIPFTQRNQIGRFVKDYFGKVKSAAQVSREECISAFISSLKESGRRQVLPPLGRLPLGMLLRLRYSLSELPPLCRDRSRFPLFVNFESPE